MAARGVYRGIFSAMLDDPDFQALSPAARHTLLTLRLCSQNNAASIFRHYLEVTCAQTGYPQKAQEAALRELEKGGWIIRDGVVLWIKNGLRYDPSIRLSHPRHLEAIRRAVSGLPKLPIVKKFYVYYNLAKALGTAFGKARVKGSEELGSYPSQGRTKSTLVDQRSDARARRTQNLKEESQTESGAQGEALGLSVRDVPRSAVAPSESDNGHQRMVAAILEARSKGELSVEEARAKLAELGVVQT